jgi:hypothetical protein
MVEVARTRAARDQADVTFDVRDVSEPLGFADASLGGVLAILVEDQGLTVVEGHGGPGQVSVLARA